MPKNRKKPGTRVIEKRLFIVCEGMKDKSESVYFKSFIKCCRLAGDKVDVKVIDINKNTGKELVKEAKKIKEFPNDIAWVVYDKDGYTKHPETFDMAKINKINIGFSAISFEYWILLHYEFTSRAFSNSDEIISYLKSNNYIDYSKSSLDIYNKTKDLLDTAIKNAKKIQIYQKTGHPAGTQIFEYDSYTDLDKLIEDIKKMETK